MTNEKEQQEIKEGEKFFKINKKIKEREILRRALMIENVGDLQTMFEEKLYKVEFDKWSAFLAQLEIYYTRAEVWRFLFIKKRLIDKYRMKFEMLLDVPITRLENIAKYAKTKEEVDDLYHKAKTLLPRDWRDTINQLRGKPTSDNCKHKIDLYEICRVCGQKHRVDTNVTKQKE